MQWGITDCFLGLGGFALLCWSAVDKSVGFIYWVKYLFCLFGIQMGKLYNWNVFYAGEWLLFKEKMKKYDGIIQKTQTRYSIYEFETVALSIACDDVRGEYISFSVKMPRSRSAVYWFITDFLFFSL